MIRFVNTVAELGNVDICICHFYGCLMLSVFVVVFIELCGK